MFKRRSTLILTLFFIALFSFIYSSRALADLTAYYPESGKALEAELIFTPQSTVDLTTPELELKLLDAQTIIQQRLIHLGLEPQQVIVQHGQIGVDLLNSENPAYVSNILTRVGYVEFINGGSVTPPLGQRIETGAQTNKDKDIYQTLFDGQDVAEITPPDLATGQIFYELTLHPAAAARVDAFFRGNSSDYVCIAVDKEVIGCSKMYHWSDNMLEILPNLSGGSLLNLADLALFVESGPLPIALTIE